MYSAAGRFTEPARRWSSVWRARSRRKSACECRESATSPASLAVSKLADDRLRSALGERRNPPQAEEIEDAKWFKVLQLTKLPSKISIARRLIDAVVDEMRGAQVK